MKTVAYEIAEDLHRAVVFEIDEEDGHRMVEDIMESDDRKALEDAVWEKHGDLEVEDADQVRQTTQAKRREQLQLRKERLLAELAEVERELEHG